ncbi:hypothetical protein CL622_08580 [archaeon]|nr:hypothetical protein [archaeon]|tara:strand:+ start:1154 stop:1582 length:429 start_codon:yes stop_codon:yes gene_type:complete
MAKLKTRIIVCVEKDANGVYWGTTQNIPGVVSADGSSLQEMKENLNDALSLYLETAEDINEKEITAMFDNGFELQFKLDLSELFEKIKVLNKSAFAGRVGINPSLLRQYASKSNTTYISESRAKEIEAGLHELGEELQAVRL